MGKDELLDAGFMNPALVEQLYESYLQNPTSVDPSWQTHFASLGPTPAPTPAAPTPSAAGGDDSLRSYRLIEAYRTYGHLLAHINPIETEPPPHPKELDPATLGFSSDEMGKPFPTWGLLAEESAPLTQLIDRLKSIYSNGIGYEYMGLQNPEMEAFIQSQIEPPGKPTPLNIEQKTQILQNLNRSELLEVFLHTKYTGQKRFSLEGAETVIPVLGGVIEEGASHGFKEVIIGMAHRGRLNVLTNIMQKSYSNVFSEFEEGFIPGSFEGSGDVKYHKGYTSVVNTDSGNDVTVTLADNPSHLEAVDGVVLGYARARQVKIGDDLAQKAVVPLLIHGDAAVSGQGVIYETMQMHKLAGYGCGGTLHLVINNQIGFTTLPKDSRSTRYCTDIARTFSAPVFHVNAEDPESCLQATYLAVQLRQRFGCDVFIDVNGYRKYGHNESDEPAFTQPLQYQLIRKKRPIRELYRDNLIQQGVLEKEMAERLEEEFKASLQKELEEGFGEGKTAEQHAESIEERYRMSTERIFSVVKTGVSQKKLKEAAKLFCRVPEGFALNRKLQRLLEQRLQMMEKGGIDWGMGEHLAFATLLLENKHVRLSGQDVRRGTFSHRHAMWMDQKTAKKYFPLSQMTPEQGRFDVFNSLLSEYGVMGFDLGYSQAYEDALVIWEGQFGDFANGAQIMIDQFLATAEEKWGRKCQLTLMLPHGMEGQGPEHSSARMERFLQLSGDNNMMVCNCTTPAQLFHVLRRQVHAEWKKPLVLFTPKGLLRLPECVSTLKDFSEESFREVIDDGGADPEKVKRLLFCSGRVYYDLIREREASGNGDTAIIRLEQLYPFDYESVTEIFAKYEKTERVIWVQEEHKNMGAWHHVRGFFWRVIPPGLSLEYCGRKRRAAPATGSPAVHKQELKELLDSLFSKEMVNAS